MNTNSNELTNHEAGNVENNGDQVQNAEQLSGETSIPAADEEGENNGLIETDPTTEQELPVAAIAAVLEPIMSTDSHFIKANTDPVTLEELKTSHIIPVFTKDNEPLISQYQFIELTMKVVAEFFPDEQIAHPSIRVSHPVKGRIPSAKNKKVEELEEHEKTFYCDRMTFGIEIPAIKSNVGSNTLSLVIGGIKVYGQDNISGKKGSPEHFKLFVGYVNSVCANLCVSVDGLQDNLEVVSLEELETAIRTLLQRYNSETHILQLRELNNYSLTFNQFTSIVGKARVYSYMPAKDKLNIPEFLFTEAQVNVVCKDYLEDEFFGRDADWNITLWQFYNLLTESVKKAYIHDFLAKAANCFTFVEQLKVSLQNGTPNWFL